MRELILASTSPWRRALLAEVGLAVRCEAPGVDEASDEADPEALARELAVRKARAVAARFPDAWVIGADQVAFDLEDRAPFGKPRDPADHLARLRGMVGRTHGLVTGLALTGPGFEDVIAEETRMVVRADLADDELAAYVATGEGSGCAGGYAAERRGAFLFARVDGDFFNVVGMPVLRLFELFRHRGWRFR